MSAKFSAAKSDYNKDETFAKFNVDGAVKVTVSEAIAKDSGENYITVYGQVELPLVGVEQIGSPMWVFEPCLCKFQIPKKDYTNEYNGKKTEVKQTPGMRAALHLITTYGFDKPFKGLFDFSIADAVADSIVTHKNPDGTDLATGQLQMIGQYFMHLEPLEKLEKLEGKEIKEYSKGGAYGGKGGGQKESEKLADRLAFVKAQMLPDSESGVVFASIYGTEFEREHLEFIKTLLSSLFS